MAAGLGLLDRMALFFEEDGSLTESSHALLRPDNPDAEVTDARVMADAISFAVVNGQFEAIDFLLEKGADVNALTLSLFASGLTPLHYACWLNKSDMVPFLLDRGADPMLIDSSDPEAPPLGWAIENGRSEIVAYYGKARRLHGT